ncbi:MAG: methionyl-tRNA formyltransferase [Gemmatimonas sp.]
MTRLTLAFMGTSPFGLPALEAIVAAGHAVACVYTRAPKPAGRGYGVRKTPIHEAAERLGLPVRTPASLKDPAEQDAFRALALDVAVVAAYGLILPKAILDAPRLGCLNIHGSLLPRWRGAAPVERAILAGDEATGVTIMQMDEGLDTGGMLLTESVAVDRLTAGEMHERLSAMGAPLIVRALDGVAAGTLAAIPQPAEGATYAKKIEPAEARLDWREPAVALERRVRAFAPRPGAWFVHDNARIKVFAADVIDDGSRAVPGTVLDERLTIKCGEGALRLTVLQREGKGKMPADAFLRGFALARGAVLESAGG